MRLIRIDNETALNLDAVATIKFSNDDSGPVALVKFLSVEPRARGLVSETFSGPAARNLDRMLADVEPAPHEGTIPDLQADLARPKAWYFLNGGDRGRYFIAFVNSKGSCSMRTFDADTGRFLSKKYRAGNYQDQFADVIQNAVEMAVDSQPNLERDCKVRLPESVLVQLKKQLNQA